MTNNQIKNQDYYYRVFCMAHIIGIDDNDLDAIWENGTIVYDLFLESKFNVDTMSELECMELFYREYKARQEFLKRGTYMMLDTQIRESIINIIDSLNAINVDGETMEFIIKNVGMEDQMLSQLGYPLRVENESLKHRLGVILEDQVFIRDFIYRNVSDVFYKPTTQCDSAITHLNNIESACDLNSNESLAWNLKS